MQKALSEEQVQGIAEKMEETLAEADQARQNEAEERRVAARREREERARAELQAEQEQQAEQERQAAARRTEKATREAVEATAEIVVDGTREVAHAVAGTHQATVRVLEATGEAVERTAAAASMMPRTGFLFWDMMFGLSGASSSREIATRAANAPGFVSRQAARNEEVIPLAEEILVVGKRTVSTGTTRIRRYVVETPAEQKVTLTRERVVVERRRPVTNKVSGETLTELTIEIVETDEIPVVAKSVQMREEVVVRTERTEHLETVRDTVRQDEVEIEHGNARQRARARG